MRASITSNAAAILARMRQRQQRMEKALGAAARELAPVMARETKGLLQSEIYSVPIPRRRGRRGKGRWRRSGNLKRRERAYADGVTVVLENQANYAAARSALGSKGPENRAGRKNRPPTRSIQWQAEAVRKRRGYILQVRRKHVLEVLTG